MALKEDIQKALAELRKNESRKFEQSVDLIINLQKFDLKKNAVNAFTGLPHKVKDKKICGFFEVENKNIFTITPEKFKSYSIKSKMKALVNSYDFFIAQASIMPKVATTFGRVLGPLGKMPSPQLGILMDINDKTINEIVEKINSSVKIRTKEASIKIAIGKEKMKDEDIAENAVSIYEFLLKTLPRNKENIKNIYIKFTMTKPQKLSIR